MSIIYKKDHRRLVDGKKVLNRHQQFRALGEVVAAAFSSFAKVHESMHAAAIARMNARTVLDKLRVKRDAQVAALQALYAWGYHNAVWPSFEDWRGGELPGPVIRGNLFPGGNPSKAGRSRQWLHSAVGMLVEAIKAGKAEDLPASCMPEAYVTELIAAYDEYDAGMAAVDEAQGVHDQVYAALEAVRADWDRAFKLLAASTRLALESEGKGERLSSLIPVASDRSRDAEEETPPEPAIDAVEPEVEPEADEPSDVIELVPLAEEDVAA